MAIIEYTKPRWLSQLFFTAIEFVLLAYPTVDIHLKLAKHYLIHLK